MRQRVQVTKWQSKKTPWCDIFLHSSPFLDIEDYTRLLGSLFGDMGGGNSYMLFHTQIIRSPLCRQRKDCVVKFRSRPSTMVSPGPSFQILPPPPSPHKWPSFTPPPPPPPPPWNALRFPPKILQAVKFPPRHVHHVIWLVSWLCAHLINLFCWSWCMALRTALQPALWDSNHGLSVQTGRPPQTWPTSWLGDRHVMHLSMLCPTTPHTGIGGARWGFVTVKVTNPPPLGDDILWQTPTNPHLAPPYEVGFIGDLTIKSLATPPTSM